MSHDFPPIPPNARNADLAVRLRAEYDAESFAEIHRLLEGHGTVSITPLPTGLFSATVTTDYSKGTNYHAVWVRDNVHIAYAHYINGRPAVAVRTVEALARFFSTQRTRFENASQGTLPMQRPHVRFDGDVLAEIDQPWAHAQNDALGYFLWLYATLALDSTLSPERWDIEMLARFARYFRAIEYWSDEDSGHWEELRKISASSIGVVIAGLRQLQKLVRQTDRIGEEGENRLVPSHVRNHLLSAISLDELCLSIESGDAVLRSILPAECVQDEPGKKRQYDSALLFLVHPLNVVDEAMAEIIVRQTVDSLGGATGIKRYPGDSFYCTDYESRMARRQDDPTRDFSQDMGERDTLFRPGDEEAEWCLFDPIVSIYYGRRYLRLGDTEDLRRQTEHLNRSLAQVTSDDPPRCRAFQCPELYYTEHGKTQTSRATPLLWTQANLWTALESMRQSLEYRTGTQKR